MEEYEVKKTSLFKIDSDNKEEVKDEFVEGLKEKLGDVTEEQREGFSKFRATMNRRKIDLSERQLVFMASIPTYWLEIIGDLIVTVDSQRGGNLEDGGLFNNYLSKMTSEEIIREIMYIDKLDKELENAYDEGAGVEEVDVRATNLLSEMKDMKTKLKEISMI